MYLDELVSFSPLIFTCLFQFLRVIYFSSFFEVLSIRIYTSLTILLAIILDTVAIIFLKNHAVQRYRRKNYHLFSSQARKNSMNIDNAYPIDKKFAHSETSLTNKSSDKRSICLLNYKHPREFRAVRKMLISSRISRSHENDRAEACFEARYRSIDRRALVIREGLDPRGIESDVIRG